MISSVELSELGLATVEETRRTMLPKAVAVFSRKGKQIATIQHFTGTKSARDIKTALKSANPKLSGKELAKRVNETLRGEVDIRQQLGVAWLQAAYQSGYTSDAGRLGKNTGALRLVKVKPEVAVLEDKPAVNWESALEAFGLSKADIDAIRALGAK